MKQIKLEHFDEWWRTAKPPATIPILAEEPYFGFFEVSSKVKTSLAFRILSGTDWSESPSHYPEKFLTA
ncbi:MAG: hypothetical protein RLZZ435_804 [Cyanobacteriota bacterium]|jgi:hypothetical protein